MARELSFDEAQRRLKQLEDDVQKAEQEHARAEGQLTAALAEKASVEAQCVAVGVTPEDLEGEIARQAQIVHTALDAAFNVLLAVDEPPAEDETNSEIDTLLEGDKI